MIEGILTDVDGVLVGDRPGFNYPDPSEEVVARLHEIRNMGMPISLCTAKPYFAIENLVQELKLEGPQFSDNAAVVTEGKDGSHIEVKRLHIGAAKRMIDFCLDNDLPVAIHTPDRYLADKRFEGYEEQEEYADILGRKPELVGNLYVALGAAPVRLHVALDRDNTTMRNKLSEAAGNELSVSWAGHPQMQNRDAALITRADVSKATAPETMAQFHGIATNDILAIGDSTSDSEFIEVCGVGVAMGNATDQLKRLVLAMGDNGYVAPHIDDDGLVAAINQFIPRQRREGDPAPILPKQRIHPAHQNIREITLDKQRRANK